MLWYGSFIFHVERWPRCAIYARWEGGREYEEMIP